MLLISSWVAFSLVVAVAASTRQRSWLGWLVLALITSPLFACLLLLALPDLRRRPLRVVDSVVVAPEPRRGYIRVTTPKERW